MAVTPDILKAAKTFRAELNANDLAAIRNMTRLYDETWARLSERLSDLTQQIEAAKKLGKQAVARIPGSGAVLLEGEYSINWLARQERYRALIWQTEWEMKLLADKTAEAATIHQQTLTDLGLQHSRGLMAAGLGPVPPELARAGYAWGWNQVPREALTNLVGFLGDGSPLAYKWAGLPSATVDGIRAEFEAGFAQGTGPRQITAAIKRRFGGALDNALVTVRTEALRSYRTASAESYRANDDVVKGWIWSSAMGPRTCAACIGMNGSEHPLTEEMSDHPSGRCCALPITRTWKELMPDADLGEYEETSVKGWSPEEPFRKLSEADQRKILGRTKFEAWQAGDLKLRDIPGKVKSKVWGTSYRPKSNKELGLVGKPAQAVSAAGVSGAIVEAPVTWMQPSGRTFLENNAGWRANGGLSEAVVRVPTIEEKAAIQTALEQLDKRTNLTRDLVDSEGRSLLRVSFLDKTDPRVFAAASDTTVAVTGNAVTHIAITDVGLARAGKVSAKFVDQSLPGIVRHEIAHRYTELQHPRAVAWRKLWWAEDNKWISGYGTANSDEGFAEFICKVADPAFNLKTLPKPYLSYYNKWVK